jgi:hypothetical protein
MSLKTLNNAIILVSDITKGMKSVGSKALLNISNNISILEYQIQYLKKYYYPINIYLSTGFDHEKILKATHKYKNIYYSYSSHYEKENQVGSLMRCFHEYNIKNNTIVFTNGFIPMEKITINKNECSIEVTQKITKLPFEIGANIEDNPTHLFYGLPNKWTEYVHLNIKAIQYISNKLNTNPKKYSTMFLFELINLLIDNDIPIHSKNIYKNLPIKINTIKDLNIAQKYYEKHLHNKIKQKAE